MGDGELGLPPRHSVLAWLEMDGDLGWFGGMDGGLGWLGRMDGGFGWLGRMDGGLGWPGGMDGGLGWPGGMDGGLGWPGGMEGGLSCGALDAETGLLKSRARRLGSGVGAYTMSCSMSKFNKATASKSKLCEGLAGSVAWRFSLRGAWGVDKP